MAGRYIIKLPACTSFSFWLSNLNGAMYNENCAMICNVLLSAICNVVHLEQWLWAWRCTCYCYAMFAMMCNGVHLGQWRGEMYLLLLCNVMQSTILCKCFAIWCKVQYAMLCNPQYYALFRNIVQSALCNVVHLGQWLGEMYLLLLCNVLQSTILCKCFAIWCKVQYAMLCNPQYYVCTVSQYCAKCTVVHLGQGLGAMWFPLMFISSNFSHFLQARSLKTKQTFHVSSAFFHLLPLEHLHLKNLFGFA